MRSAGLLCDDELILSHTICCSAPRPETDIEHQTLEVTYQIKNTLYRIKTHVIHGSKFDNNTAIMVFNFDENKNGGACLSRVSDVEIKFSSCVQYP